MNLDLQSTVCPRCGVGRMNKRPVDISTKYDDIFNELPFRKKILFLLFPPPVWQSENKIVRLILRQYPHDIETYLCDECGFIENNYLPIAPKYTRPMTKSQLLIVIAITIASAGLAFLFSLATK
jgi:predicted RNA-binding Zn-ribbon protein involved in translation (DUF1610 family)